jgi:hypothetical protein
MQDVAKATSTHRDPRWVGCDDGIKSQSPSSGSTVSDEHSECYRQTTFCILILALLISCSFLCPQHTAGGRSEQERPGIRTESDIIVASDFRVTMSSPQSTPREPATYTSANSSASPDPNPPTVIYDSERLPPLTPDSLEPPDIDSILSRKRKWYRAVLALELPRAWQVGLTGLSICLSALQANGVYVWPT